MLLYNHILFVSLVSQFCFLFSVFAGVEADLFSCIFSTFRSLPLHPLHFCHISFLLLFFVLLFCLWIWNKPKAISIKFLCTVYIKWSITVNLLSFFLRLKQMWVSWVFYISWHCAELLYIRLKDLCLPLNTEAQGISSIVASQDHKTLFSNMSQCIISSNFCNSYKSKRIKDKNWFIFPFLNFYFLKLVK